MTVAVQNMLQYQQVLQDAAISLSGNRNLPIPIAEITEALRVNISRSNPGKRTKGHLLLTASKAEIVLPATDNSSSDYTPWERFLIAHELGHLILDRRCGSRPLGKSEYWKHEELCDGFARWLLLPPWVARLVERGCYSPSQRLNLCQHLAITAQIPWKTAAFRISEWDSTTRFLLLLGDAHDASFHVGLSTFPGKKGVRTLLARDQNLSKVLSAIPVGGSLFIETQMLRCFDFVNEVKSCLAFRNSLNEIKVALVGIKAP